MFRLLVPSFHLEKLGSIVTKSLGRIVDIRVWSLKSLYKNSEFCFSRLCSLCEPKRLVANHVLLLNNKKTIKNL